MGERLPGRTDAGRRIRVLFVGDRPPVQPDLRRHLAFNDFAVGAVGSGREAVEAVRGGGIDVVLMELPLLGEFGEEALEEIRRAAPATEVIVLTDRPSMVSALRCARSGCFCYVEAPCEEDELADLVVGACRNDASRRPKGAA